MLLPGQLPSGEQAGANPHGYSWSLAQELFGVHALREGFVGECVPARRRESRIIAPRMATPDPGFIAGFEACFATTVATAGRFLQLAKPS